GGVAGCDIGSTGGRSGGTEHAGYSGTGHSHGFSAQGAGLGQNQGASVIDASGDQPVQGPAGNLGVDRTCQVSSASVFLVQGDGLVVCTQCNAEGASCSVGAGSLSLYTGSRDRSSSEGVASTVTGNCQGCTAESGTSLAQGYVAAINVNISLNNTIQV